MVLSFFIMYPTRVGGKHGVVWVSDQRRIAIHYLTTWFLLDVFSIAVTAHPTLARALCAPWSILHFLIYSLNDAGLGGRLRRRRHQRLR